MSGPPLNALSEVRCITGFVHVRHGAAGVLAWVHYIYRDAASSRCCPDSTHLPL